MKEERIDMNLKSSSGDLGDKAAYQAPEVSVSALRLVTLGGTPGSPDSGGSTTEEPASGRQPGGEIITPEHPDM